MACSIAKVLSVGVWAVYALTACSLLADFPSPPTDGGSDGDGDADADTDADLDEIDVPDAGCIVPSGIDDETLQERSCPRLDEATVPFFVFEDHDYTLQTEACIIDGNHGIPTCLVPMGESWVCVVVVERFYIEAFGKLYVEGPFPGVILSAGEVRVSGLVSADAHSDQGGPGGGDGGSSPGARGEGLGYGHAGRTGGGEQSDGGGGGGGLGENGGAGGCFLKGLGGQIVGSCADLFLRGGSGGGSGGDEEGGRGGGGGGALHLFSREAILINQGGSISASGGPGEEGTTGSDDGGGGGGSGGTLLLEAPAVVVQGSALAEGGIGGNGGEELSEGGMAGSGDTPEGGVGDCHIGDGGGGGGGSAGRVIIRSVAGRYQGSGSVSPNLEMCMTHYVSCE